MRGNTARSWRTSKCAQGEIRKITKELMMEKPVITLYDNVANSYKEPFYPPTRGVALREFQDAVNNPQNAQLHNHASDFDLYVIGTWDDQTGVMVVFDKAEKLANCASLKLETTNGNDA